MLTYRDKTKGLKQILGGQNEIIIHQRNLEFLMT